ncbi:MAG: NAD(P)/FAD-dependent oxidoreductase [Paracoccaceae bacterium]
MPFEARPAGPRRIAVIGGGISGMGAAHMLANDNAVTLFEAEPRLGGHARTKIAGKRMDQPVDTGFIVFNKANYPHMVRLFQSLDVPIVTSDMSFAASLRGGKIEYGLRNLRALFAQPRNLVNPKFLRMARDVMYFNAHALERCTDPTQSIGDFLAELGTGDWFRNYYLLPLSGAIWSTPTHKILDFPAYALLQFFENHALLHHSGQHQWYTVDGGSVEYVTRLQAAMQRQNVDLRLGAPIAGVRRIQHGPLQKVDIRPHGGEWESFDDVVFATHSDDSLAMLSDARPDETRALSAIRYQPNRVVLHADDRIMPRRRACWSSWNYTEDGAKTMNQIDLTYWMNCLQPIPKDDPLFVTLNSTRTIREDLIYDETTLRHPVFDLAALDGQSAVRVFNGTANTWFCGAWMKNGFHEDGLGSAVDVVHALRSRYAVDIAA